MESNGGSIKIIRIAIVESYTDGDGKKFAPPDGESLYVFTVQISTGQFDYQAAIERATGGDLQWKQKPITVTYQLGGQNMDIDPEAGSGTGGDGTDQTFIAAIKSGVGTRVKLSDGGVDQYLQLPTGVRVEDSSLSWFYHSDTHGSDLNQTLPTFSQAFTRPQDEGGDRETISYDLTVKSVYVLPYDTTLGWAPKGSKWVEVVATQACANSTYTEQCETDSSGWQITADGKKYGAKDTTMPRPDSAVTEGTGRTLFQVPVNTDQVSADFGTKVVRLAPLDDNRIRGSYTARFKPLTISLP